MSLSKVVWEGWTVQHFVDDLQPTLEMIQHNRSCHRPLKTKAELKEWCMENQPYYKKHIPAVVNHFAKKYNL